MQRRKKKYIAAGIIGALVFSLYTLSPAEVFAEENAAALTAGVARVLDRTSEIPGQQEDGEMPTDNAVVLASGDYEEQMIMVDAGAPAGEEKDNTQEDGGETAADNTNAVETGAGVYEDEPGIMAENQPPGETQQEEAQAAEQGADTAPGASGDAVAAGQKAVDISAPSAILMESSTGAVLYEKNPDEVLRPASITKIMTLILIFDALEAGKIKLEDTVSVSEYAASMGGSQVFLEPGETQTVDTMIKCISVASANDACVAYREGKPCIRRRVDTEHFLLSSSVRWCYNTQNDG